MPLTQEMISNVLGSSKSKPKILTEDDKVKILEMCESGDFAFQEIVDEIQSTNELVKSTHVKNYLQRQLKKAE